MATVLINVCTGVYGFALGELRGSAVLGRSLDVTVQMQAGDSEEITTSCISAEVYFADSRQKTPRLALISPPDGSSPNPSVRIQSIDAVNEPVVSVLLRSSCGSSTMRRYLLLADLPPIANPTMSVAQSSPEVAAKQVFVPVAPPVVVLAQPEISATATPGLAQVNVAKAGKKAVNPAQAASGAAPGTRKAVVRANGKSMLKLDPLEMLSDRMDSLDSAMVFAPTEDTQLHTRQISSLQADIKFMREQAAQNDAKLLELRSQLEDAQQGPWLMLYGVMALLVLSVAALAWFLLRRGKSSGKAWWHNHDEDDATPMHPNAQAHSPLHGAPDVAKPSGALPAAVVPATPRAPVVSKKAEAKPTPAPEASVDLNRFMLSEANQATAVFKGANSIHHISLEPILDIRQQAEFFVSLGQTDRALDILKKQIQDSSEPNPFVYLDLIGLCHLLGLKPDFYEQREAFHKNFNGVIPEFQAFNHEGRDLQAYPEVMTALVQLWPTMRALVLLDTCIFHNPQARTQASFELAAFRDLLMLFALAEEVVVDMPPPAAVESKPAPLPVSRVAVEPAPAAGASANLPPLPSLAGDKAPAGVRVVSASEFSLPSSALFETTEVFASEVPEPLKELHHPSSAEPHAPMLDMDFSSSSLLAEPDVGINVASAPSTSQPAGSRWPVNKKTA